MFSAKGEQIVQNKVSIIVPVYKVERELDRCVQSLFKQTYNNLEIILVDDGSPDKCPELCENYAEMDKRVKVIHKENGGLSDARNAGLKQATGEYILYVDSDDYIDLDTCERFIKAAGNQKIDIIVGNAIMEKSDGKEMMIHSATPSGITYTAKQFIMSAVKAYQWYAPAWLNMYRRDFLLDNQLYFKKGIYFEDVQMLPRIFLQAKKITCIDGTFYHYIIRENSIMTSQKDEKKKNDSIQNLKEWKEQFDLVDDVDLKECLYGMLVKMYIHECSQYGITTKEIEGMDARFILRNSLNYRERLKATMWLCFPRLLIKH